MYLMKEYEMHDFAKREFAFAPSKIKGTMF